jgi:hypothetical protein
MVVSVDPDAAGVARLRRLGGDGIPTAPVSAGAGMSPQ